MWFTKTYEALASKYAYGDLVPVGIDPFHTIYRNIADDMLTYRKALPDTTVQAIRTTAEMRFARDFSPDAFQTLRRLRETPAFSWSGGCRPRTIPT